jgi:hypothetical protein
MMRRFAAGLLACLAAGAAQATPLRDLATGLAVDPPPGYVARSEAPGRQHAASFSVKRPGDTGEGCQVGFTPVPANARRTQDQINALVASPAGQQAGVQMLAPVYDVTEAANVRLGAVNALVLLASFKPHQKLPPEARQIRTLFALLETPRGRTSIACAAKAAEFPMRRAEFEAVVRGTTAP